MIIGTRGLLGLWPLGDSGTRAADLAKGHRGRYSGGPARTGALIQIAQDGARRFDGANDRLLVPAGAIGKPASTTVELWVQPGRGGGRKRGIVLTDSRVPLHDGFTLYLDARRRPVFAVDGKRGRRGTVTGPAMKAGRTYLLGASYDGKRLAIFVNGVQRATRSYRGGIDYAGGRSILVGGPAKGRSGGLAAYSGRARRARGVRPGARRRDADRPLPARHGGRLTNPEVTPERFREGIEGSFPGDLGIEVIRIEDDRWRAGSRSTAATSTPAATCTAACGSGSPTPSPPGAPSATSRPARTSRPPS